MSSTSLTQLNATIADALADQGWCVIPAYFESALTKTLTQELLQLLQLQQLHKAGIGRGNSLQHNSLVRQDSIYWLDAQTPAQQAYLQRMETLRQALNQALFLGLFELEAHFAVYPPGAFYKKHYDSFQGASNRIVSVVTYLNHQWPADAGGELCIYATDDSRQAVIKPDAGQLVVFLSEAIAHEVLPAQQHRLSIAAWFRLNGNQ